MHDTDRLIENITGSKNYLKELEKVVGNVLTIDKKYFMDVSSANLIDDREVRKILVNLKGNTISRDFFEKSMSVDYNSSILVEKKKNGKVKKSINDFFRPQRFIKSEYFKLLKHIEKTANRLLESYGSTKESLDSIIQTQPDLPEIKNFFGYKLQTQNDLDSMISLRLHAGNIIKRYMEPMYDVRATMEKNWHILDPLFKQTTSFEISQHDIKEMLLMFIVAKYRCIITDNNKYYVKLFMNIINNGEDTSGIGKMDAPRFLELLDTINFDSIDKKQNIYTFAEKSKNVIKKIVENKDVNTEEIMKEIESIMSDINKPKDTDNTPEPQEENTENNDILAGL